MKMWAIILALAIGMALLPGFRDKAEITGQGGGHSRRRGCGGRKGGFVGGEGIRPGGGDDENRRKPHRAGEERHRGLRGGGALHRRLHAGFRHPDGPGSLYSPQQGGGIGDGGGENRTLAPAAGFFHAGS